MRTLFCWLPIVLLEACAGPTLMPALDGGVELVGEGADAGALVDAGVDAGVPDAGIDAGVLDCSAPVVLTGAFVDPARSLSAFEVHNQTSRAVDLSMWTMRIRSVGGFLVAPLGGTVAAGGFRSFANDAGFGDEAQSLIRLDSRFASIELIGPSGMPCTAEGDHLWWGSVMPICAGTQLSSLPASGRVGYRRDDPCTPPQWVSSVEPLRGSQTAVQRCACP